MNSGTRRRDDDRVWRPHLGSDLGETRLHLNQLDLRMDSLAAGIEAGEGTVGKLLTDTALADEAQTLLAHANQMMSELKVVVTKLNAAAGNVQSGVVRFPEITSAVADATTHLPGLLQQTETSMRELERLIDAMQRHWLLRKYVDQTNHPSLHPDGNRLPREKPAKRLLSPRAR